MASHVSLLTTFMPQFKTCWILLTVEPCPPWEACNSVTTSAVSPPVELSCNECDEAECGSGCPEPFSSALPLELLPLTSQTICDAALQSQGAFCFCTAPYVYVAETGFQRSWSLQTTWHPALHPGSFTSLKEPRDELKGETIIITPDMGVCKGSITGSHTAEGLRFQIPGLQHGEWENWHCSNAACHSTVYWLPASSLELWPDQGEENLPPLYILDKVTTKKPEKKNKTNITLGSPVRGRLEGCTQSKEPVNQRWNVTEICYIHLVFCYWLYLKRRVNQKWCQCGMLKGVKWKGFTVCSSGYHFVVTARQRDDVTVQKLELKVLSWRLFPFSAWFHWCLACLSFVSLLCDWFDDYLLPGEQKC